MASTGRVLSLDLGTSRVKALVCSAAGDILASTDRPYPLTVGAGGRAEQDPADWIAAIIACTRELSALGEDIWPPAICSITGQMHGLVALDAGGEPVRPAMICSDFRAHEELAAIEGRLSPERILRVTGSPGLAMFPGPKALWMDRHEPDNAARIRTILLPKDYVGYALTGQIATDPSDASGTMLYDIHRDRWDEDLCAASSVAPGWLPPVRPASEVRGGVRPAFASRSDLPASIPVIVGGGDLPTTILGTGVVDEADIGISLGTAGITFRLAQRVQDEILGRVFYFRHVMDRTVVSIGSNPGAGFSVRWFAEQVLEEPDLITYVGDPSRLPEEKPTLFFLPLLLGSGNPDMDYKARGAFIGLSHHHRREDLRRAILEGVSYSIRQSFELLQIDRPPLERVLVCGGGSYNEEWLNILANVIDRPLITLRQKDTAVLGGAALAAYAAGWFATLEEAAETFARPAHAVHPSEEGAALYDAAYRDYLQLSDMMRELRRKGMWES
jgi:xylulokinase